MAQFVFDARIVDGDNGNPAAGTDATTLLIGIQEGELPAETFDYPITDGQFEAILEFRAFTEPTRIRVGIEGSTTELLTAPPQFVPWLSQGFMRVVTAPPSSCVPVGFNVMEAPRVRFGMVQSGTFALVAGGTTPSDVQLEFFDVLRWDSNTNTLDDLNEALEPFGETRAASIDETQILVLAAEAAPFVFDMADASNRRTVVELHRGAGPRSALVSVPGLGAMVIGGEAADEAPQSGVSLVEPGGDVTSLELSVPRSGPAATALGTDVLVVGGNAESNAEILFEGAPIGQPVAGVPDGVREGGLLVGDGESRALWIGGTADAATPRKDTVRFDSCPDTCMSGAGPQWERARMNALQPAQSTLVIGGDGSRLVDEVRWDGENVEVAPLLLQLNDPRAGAGGIVLESGAFIVAGGRFSVPSSAWRSTRFRLRVCCASVSSPNSTARAARTR
ncbi:MAG: hypothetical protein JSU89_03810, partial [Myxococcales bacterium]